MSRTLNKLFSENLDKALTFLDDSLLPSTSNAVERGNRRHRKMQKTVCRVRAVNARALDEAVRADEDVGPNRSAVDRDGPPAPGSPRLGPRGTAGGTEAQHGTIAGFRWPYTARSRRMSLGSLV